MVKNITKFVHFGEPWTLVQNVELWTMNIVIDGKIMLIWAAVVTTVYFSTNNSDSIKNVTTWTQKP